LFLIGLILLHIYTIKFDKNIQLVSAAIWNSVNLYKSTPSFLQTLIPNGQVVSEENIFLIFMIQN
jgi:hypothetical protein